MPDLSAASVDGEHRPPPVIVVSHHGDFTAVIQRARALRREQEDALIELAPGVTEVADLAPVLGRFASTTTVPVVHLVGDLDALTGSQRKAARPLVLDHAAVLYDALRDRYPTINARTWVVARTGPAISEEELALFAATSQIDHQFPFAGSAMVTAASGASLDHQESDIDLQVADLLHTIGCSDLERALTESGGRAWAIGIGSVVYRPDRLVNVAVRAIDERFDRLLEQRTRDPGYGRGRDWVRGLGIGPPAPGADRADDEAELLLVGPGGGSLARDPSAGIRRLDAAMEGLDPGLWAGYIALSIDAASAPRTHPSGPASPLVQAVEQLHANLTARQAELSAMVEAAGRRHLVEQRNIPSADDWCEGAVAALEEAITELSVTTDEEVIDLADAYRRLADSAKKLPYSASTLVRALLVVVMMVVVGYTFAPIGSLVALAFSKRVLFFGDTLEENAQTWARITAIGTGTLLWIWWEAKWRKVRRLRRRYIRLAVRQLERQVQDELVAGRVRLLRALIAMIGVPSGPAGAVRPWMGRAIAAAEAVRQRAANDEDQTTSLGGGTWAVTIPGRNEPNRVIDGLTAERQRALEDAPVTALEAAPLSATQENLEDRLAETIRAALPNMAADLHRHWSTAEAIGGEALVALGAPLWSGLPEDLAARRGAEKHRHVVASAPVAELIRQREPSFEDEIGGLDPCFAANLCVTSLVLDELKRPPAKKAKPAAKRTRKRAADPGDDAPPQGESGGVT